MKSLSHALVKIISVFRTIVNIVIVVMFLMMFGIVLLNVIMRWVFNNPIAWAGELSRYSFISIIFLGAILAMKEGAHIGMDFIIEKLPEKLHRVVVQVNRVIVLFFLIVFIYASYKVMLNNTNVYSSAMRVPMSIPYLALPLGGFGMALEMLLQILHIEEAEKPNVEVSI